MQAKIFRRSTVQKALLPLLVAILLLAGPSAVFGGGSVCPPDLDIDDPAWGLSYIGKVEGAEYIVRRVFFYQRDPLLRVVKKESSGCTGEILSLIVNGRQERAVKVMGDSENTVFMLKLADDTWRSGAGIAPDTSSGSTLDIILRDANGKEVARRAFPLASLGHVSSE